MTITQQQLDTARRQHLRESIGWLATACLVSPLTAYACDRVATGVAVILGGLLAIAVIGFVTCLAAAKACGKAAGELRKKTTPQCCAKAIVKTTPGEEWVCPTCGETWMEEKLK